MLPESPSPYYRSTVFVLDISILFVNGLQGHRLLLTLNWCCSSRNPNEPHLPDRSDAVATCSPPCNTTRGNTRLKNDEWENNADLAMLAAGRATQPLEELPRLSSLGSWCLNACVLTLNMDAVQCAASGPALLACRPPQCGGGRSRLIALHVLLFLACLFLHTETACPACLRIGPRP